MIIDESNYLAHYGVLRRSGRYPWGSGGTPEQNHRSFLGMVEAMRAEGLSDAEIARGFGMTNSGKELSTREFKAMRSIALNEVKAANVATAERLRAKGMSPTEIARQMGLAGESSARALLAPGASARADAQKLAGDLLKDQIADGGYLDVGAGTELYMNMSRTKLDSVLTGLKNEGYVVENVQIDQVGSDRKTNTKVLAPEGTTYRDIVSDKAAIKTIAVKVTDDGVEHVRPPEMLDSKRIKINYDEDGGTAADGTMYIRPGVKDLDMGGAQYAQVRIAVDGTHYIKGMAVYKDDLPKGVDVVFNTNKTSTGNKLDALKEMKTTPDGKLDIENPFGATIKPGGQRGVLNIVNEEGDWSQWSKNLPSQMLSKQKHTLAKEQLDKVSNAKRAELDEILSLTNPTVRKKLLESYSDDVDSAAVHLKAAQMPRQATQVILPVSSLKDTEVYAPNFRNGERVALVRFPHGGTFEIPEVTVNNRNPEAQRLLGTKAKDAIGVNSKVAERLSGADFDGDTVLVIPNGSGKIKSSPQLQGLKNFDPKSRYPAYEGMKPMTAKQKQQEMGKASNLITDMTIKGANDHEIAAAVRHSMVVIDAEKHKLNYKQSAIDNNIASLKKKYQSTPGVEGQGASTLISRTTSDQMVNRRKFGFKIDAATGEKVYTETGESYVQKKQLKVVDPATGKKVGAVDANGRKIYDETSPGKTVVKQTKSTKGAEAKDAHELSSGTVIEKVYADHSNKLKAMANEARKAQVSTKAIPYSASARKVYAPEVQTLDAKLNIALKNAPRERQAQVIAGAVVKQKRDANPGMEKDELKKVTAKALATARQRTGASKDLVQITPNEWEAIQAGAVTNNKLTQILNNTDLTVVKQYATPRQNTVMTTQKQQRAKQLLASGRTRSEIADILGVPVSTLTSSLE